MRSRSALAALASAALALTAAAETVVIHCGKLIARPGEGAVSPATIVVENGRIARVESGMLPAQSGATLVDLSDATVLPGLIDCHTHITGELSPDGRLRAVEETDADAALRGALYARRTLEAGFTTIRNVGSMGDSAFALRDAIHAGRVPGPRILAAGRSITPSGGHGDRTHGYREDLFAMPGAYEGVADGPFECRKAVRTQVKRGADVIKLTATGGVLSATDAGTGQQFFEDELEAIVETAHALGRKVAAHAHGADGIKAALRAGVDSIEHGSFLDDEAISLFKQSGAYLVPTIFAGETVEQIAKNNPDAFVPAVRRKALEVGPVMKESVRRAHAAGVRIAFGTDCGVGPHGRNAREFELMVEAGMTPAEAIRSATITASELLGLEDEIGTIEVGKAADVIAVLGQPLDDVAVLHNVVFVMREGRIHKSR